MKLNLFGEHIVCKFDSRKRWEEVARTGVEGEVAQPIAFNLTCKEEATLEFFDVFWCFFVAFWCKGVEWSIGIAGKLLGNVWECWKFNVEDAFFIEKFDAIFFLKQVYCQFECHFCFISCCADFLGILFMNKIYHV